MNAQSIWAGHEYAYYKNRPKGTVFIRHGVSKVIALRVTKEQDYGNQRMTSYVNVRSVETGQEHRVKARDIISFWDEYEDQLNLVLEREEAQAAERLNAQRIKDAKRTKLMGLLVSLGFTAGDISMQSYSNSFCIDIDVAITVLGDLEVEVEGG